MAPALPLFPVAVVPGPELLLLLDPLLGDEFVEEFGAAVELDPLLGDGAGDEELDDEFDGGMLMVVLLDEPGVPLTFGDVAGAGAGLLIVVIVLVGVWF